MGRVDGKVALVTGAARGQGRSHAVKLAEEGADIIAVDLCEEIEYAGYPGATLDDLAETGRLVEEFDRRIVTAKADIRDADALKAVVDDGVATLGRLDIVSANAGIGTFAGDAAAMSPDLWQQTIDTNLTGQWNTCRAAVPHIIAGGEGGAIVITSSAAGLQAYANVAHYVSAKHGVIGLTRAFAVELGAHRIRVNSIAPTQVGTDMILNESVYKVFVPDKDSPTFEDFCAASEAMHLLPIPYVEPIDISNALLFLVSDEGRYITATTLTVDAGVTQY
jgi:SDR family mycofactocin-dependent oxidoreductase